jgi:hypothetical protein
VRDTSAILDKLGLSHGRVWEAAGSLASRSPTRAQLRYDRRHQQPEVWRRPLRLALHSPARARFRYAGHPASHFFNLARSFP